MDARRYLELTDVLVKEASNPVVLSAALRPAACRSAISRAYYAAFLVAHEFLDHIKVKVARSPQTHVAVQHALNNSGHSTLAVMSSKLGTLHSERLAADYEAKKASTEQPGQAALMVAVATEVIDTLDQLTTGTGPVPFDAPAAAQAILKWASLTGKTNILPK
jgi:uncharacterized protein (UPF0332 family)